MTLKYSKFIKILTTGNIKLLTISGEPDELELAKAWDSILQEYSDLSLIEDGSSGNIFMVTKSIHYTDWKIKFLYGTSTQPGALSYMKEIYTQHGIHDEELANKIVECGYDLVTYTEDKEAYLKQIYAIETEAKFLIVQLNQLTTEYLRLCPPGATPNRRSEFDYDKELMILSRFMKGPRIKSNKITVKDFCAIVRVYKEYIKANSKK